MILHAISMYVWGLRCAALGCSQTALHLPWGAPDESRIRPFSLGQVIAWLRTCTPRSLDVLLLYYTSHVPWPS